MMTALCAGGRTYPAERTIMVFETPDPVTALVDLRRQPVGSPST